MDSKLNHSFTSELGNSGKTDNLLRHTNMRIFTILLKQAWVGKHCFCMQERMSF